MPLIDSLFPQDPLSQSQSQDGTPQEPSPDARRGIEMISLVNHISKGLAGMSHQQRAYVCPSSLFGELTTARLMCRNILRY